MAAPAIGIDVAAVKAIHDHIIATVPEPSVTFERDELQHRIERRELEMKRKDKELEGLSKEVSRLQKEVKVANAEMTSLRDRNEQLQQSLMNARLANQNARDDADTRLSEARIRELELALSASIHKTSKLENELELAKQVVEGVDNRVLALNNQIEAVSKKEREALEQLQNMGMQLRTSQQLFAEKDKEFNKVINEKYISDNQVRSLSESLQTKTKELEASTAEASEFKKRVTELSKLLNVRSETNAMLRQQVEEINGTKFVVTKEEMEKFKKVEKDNLSMEKRIRELVKSVDLHMDLLHRAEEEASKAKDELKKGQEASAVIRKEFEEIKRSAGTHYEKLKAATKELVKVRRDNKDLVLQVEQLRTNPNAGKPEFENMKESLALMGKSKQEATEHQLAEAKKRKVAEESAKAMRNRISFLLEQLEQASALSVAWQEQKAILKTEISSLHLTNRDLRKRLSSVQSYYTQRNIATVIENDSFGDYEGARGKPAPGDVLSGKAGLEISALGGAFESPAASTLPNTVESYIERTLFDTILAFSSGSKVTMSKPKKKGQTGPSNLFKVKLADEGILLIEASAEDPDIEVEARELLTGLQINPFLRFCQSRPPAKANALFTEKIATILNQSRNRVTEVIEQLGDSRMEIARATARSAVSVERIQRLRDRFYFERLAKQKNVIKYVREQMRHSDMRIVLNDINAKAADYVIDLEIAMSAEQRQLKEFMTQITHTSAELTSALASSGTTTGPVGGMEIRLPDTQLDDETMHGVIGLLSGVLDDGNNNNNNNEGKESSAATPGPHSLLSSSLLSKTVLSSSPNYINRVLQINVKGNQLTDLTCKLLANVVETSPDLRVLDLRENCITEKGAKILFDATRRNITVLYVTQRQSGFMIEGHREIAGGVTQAYRERVAPESQVEFERLASTSKHPLRIDIRHNNANETVIEGVLESAMLNPTQRKGDIGLAEGSQMQLASSHYAGSRANLSYADDPNEVSVGQWSPAGLVDTVRSQSKAASLRPSSAAMTRRADSKLPTTSRPQSAIVGGRERSSSPAPAPSGGSGASIGARALALHQPFASGRGRDSDDDERDGSDSDVPRSARSARPAVPEEHRGLIAMIESSGSGNKANPAVGSMLDQSIRHIQESEGIVPSSGSKRKSKKKKSVNETILTDTKRVYQNKMHFPGEEEALAVIEARRRATQSSMSAGQKHDREQDEGPKKRPASAGVGFQAEVKGGGAASAVAASAVRNRLKVAQAQESKLSGTSRPMSASAGRGSKSSSAHSLLDSLQSLNPAALF